MLRTELSSFIRGRRKRTRKPEQVQVSSKIDPKRKRRRTKTSRWGGRNRSSLRTAVRKRKCRMRGNLLFPADARKAGNQEKRKGDVHTRAKAEIQQQSRDEPLKAKAFQQQPLRRGVPPCRCIHQLRETEGGRKRERPAGQGGQLRRHLGKKQRKTRRRAPVPQGSPMQERLRKARKKKIKVVHQAVRAENHVRHRLSLTTKRY
mmetsp:Transcript_19539/g.39346  ORF Transcript_19539/g.39346 Transcript_19539/m.39346 type:complete len:204 (-) Transcript_19539:33-644(-)